MVLVLLKRSLRPLEMHHRAPLYSPHKRWPTNAHERAFRLAPRLPSDFMIVFGRKCHLWLKERCQGRLTREMRSYGPRMPAGRRTAMHMIRDTRCIDIANRSPRKTVMKSGRLPAVSVVRRSVSPQDHMHRSGVPTSGNLPCWGGVHPDTYSAGLILLASLTLPAGITPFASRAGAGFARNTRTPATPPRGGGGTTQA